VIGLVTDSNAQMPPELVARFGITVVPVPVIVDGVTHLEGVDLDADTFYARLAAERPEVATTQPSPGQFLRAYEALARAGADAILSVHLGSSVSGTVNSARVASGSVEVPVRIVDTDTASFAVALCAWAAAEGLAAGLGLEDAAARAEGVAQATGNVFVVRGLELARAGGRLSASAPAEPGGGIPVLSMRHGTMEVVGEVADLEEAAETMSAAARAAGTDLRVGVGVADAAVTPVGDAVERRLAGTGEVREVVRYRVGPSVGVHTGPGTLGLMWASW